MRLYEGTVSHQIITPECRLGRGDDGAFDEAARRVREQYDQVVNGWSGRAEQPTLRLVLFIERPPAVAPPTDVAPAPASEAPAERPASQKTTRSERNSDRAEGAPAAPGTDGSA